MNVMNYTDAGATDLLTEVTQTEFCLGKWLCGQKHWCLKVYTKYVRKIAGSSVNERSLVEVKYIAENVFNQTYNEKPIKRSKSSVIWPDLNYSTLFWQQSYLTHLSTWLEGTTSLICLGMYWKDNRVAALRTETLLGVSVLLKRELSKVILRNVFLNS